MADVIAMMADGIAMYMIGRCCCHVADLFATVIFFVGRCYCLVADVLPLLCSFVFCWQMLLPGG